MYGESNMEIHNTIRKIDGQQELGCMTEGTQTGPCDRQEGGWGREMGGRDMGVPHG